MEADAKQLAAYPRSGQRPPQRPTEPLGKVRLYWRLWFSWRWQRARPVAATSVQALLDWADQCAIRDDADLDQLFRALRQQASTETLWSDHRLMGTVAAIINRTFGLRLRPNQIETAWLLLAGGIVELRTGEGKTWAAQLAALTAASVGVSVHLITVNDYLASRDFAQLSVVADRLGVKVSLVRADDDALNRWQAYDADIVYVTNKTLVFDALRDRQEQRNRRTRGRHRLKGRVFAIVDEADSVLIDDATVPMILSEIGPPPPALDLALFRALLAFARHCPVAQIAEQDRQGYWRLTDRGRRALADHLQPLRDQLSWDQELVRLAEDSLFAVHGLVEGVHYVVEDDRVILIDGSTGRLVPDRKWSYGLQQLVELKACVSVTGETQQLEQLTQQRFFRSYHQLSGLTGTAHECRAELWAIYDLVVRTVAPHKTPSIRMLGVHRQSTLEEAWAFVVDRSLAVAAKRAVLIGVNDVQSSKGLQAAFAARQLPVAVLDALTESGEAQVVAAAGRRGQITIATHLAGRGTDIPVDQEVLDAGGLHVIIAAVMSAQRLERQLIGRTGRQGAPGSYELVLCAEDRQWRDGLPSGWRSLASLWLKARLSAGRLRIWIQGARERLSQKRRIRTLLREQDMAQQLGFDRE